MSNNSWIYNWNVLELNWKLKLKSFQSKVPMISMQTFKDDHKFLTNDFLIFELYLIVSYSSKLNNLVLLMSNKMKQTIN